MAGGILSKLLLGRAFKLEDGNIVLLGKYYALLYEAKSMAMTMQMLYEEIGEERLFEILKEVGKVAYTQMKKAFGMEVPKQLLGPSIEMMDILGWGKLEVVELKQEKKKVYIKFKILNSPVSRYAKEMYGKKSHSCILFTGIISGVLSVLFKKDITLKEIACVCKGAPYDMFEGEGA